MTGRVAHLLLALLTCTNLMLMLGCAGSSSNLATMVEQVRPAVVRIQTNSGSGSGVIFDSTSEGGALVLTNSHVVDRAGYISVEVEDSATYRGYLQGVDYGIDLAVLSICCGKFKELAFGDVSKLKPGSEVVAMGYPLDLPGAASITRGIVSAIRLVGDTEIIQMDAPINPGNSGGPLLSASGEVLGINTFTIGKEGLGFAVSEREVQMVLPEITGDRVLAAAKPTSTPGRDATPGTPERPAGVAGTDREALLALYNSVGGDQWEHQGDWTTDRPIGQWTGVTTNDQGWVIELHLPVGPIEPDGDKIRGVIPPELGNLTELRKLAISGHIFQNELTGPIPPELGNLTNLETIIIVGGKLTGPIPAELGNLTNLEGLVIRHNDLTSIPPEIANLVNLRSLVLWDNEITGPIPPELGKLTNLERINFGSNELTGHVPTELANLTKLQYLNLAGNKLTGELPQSFTRLIQLASFSYYDNRGLCAPLNPSMQGWLLRIPEVSGEFAKRRPTCPRQ